MPDLHHQRPYCPPTHRIPGDGDLLQIELFPPVAVILSSLLLVRDMSRPFVTVDYFSHEWNALDLGCASLELRRQVAEIRRKLIFAQNDLDVQHDAVRHWGLGVPSSPAFASISKRKSRLVSDERRLCRLENVAWRQHAAQGGPKTHPVDINWQKTSDIIWLYGPLFRRDDNDTDFETRLAGVSDAIVHNQCRTSNPSETCPLKPALRKRGLQTKQEYVETLLGKAAIRKHKRHSFPVDRCASSDVDAIMAAIEQQHRKSLRFKPDVLEYIYHADMPLQCSSSSRPPKNKRSSSSTGCGKSSSAACQKAKALLLAARSNNPPCTSTAAATLPHSPSPSLSNDAIAHSENRTSWFWCLLSPVTGIRTPPRSLSPSSLSIFPTNNNTHAPLDSAPSLYANLRSFSADMLALMKTAAAQGNRPRVGLSMAQQQQQQQGQWC